MEIEVLTNRRKIRRQREGKGSRGRKMGREREGLTNGDGGDALLIFSATVADAQRPPPPLGGGGDGSRHVTSVPSSSPR
jgi:hypothetical protein